MLLTQGKDRFNNGQTLTSYRFTGQREEAGLGVLLRCAMVRSQPGPLYPKLQRIQDRNGLILEATTSVAYTVSRLTDKFSLSLAQSAGVSNPL